MIGGKGSSVKGSGEERASTRSASAAGMIDKIISQYFSDVRKRRRENKCEYCTAFSLV